MPRVVVTSKTGPKRELGWLATPDFSSTVSIDTSPNLNSLSIHVLEC